MKCIIGTSLASFVLIIMIIATNGWQEPESRASSAVEKSYIVQGDDLSRVARAVASVGGEVTHQLGLINAVAARLGPAAVKALGHSPDIHQIYSDAEVRTAVAGTGDLAAGLTAKWATQCPEGDFGNSVYPSQVGATALHDIGVTGAGVAVAVVDTGMWSSHFIFNDASGEARVIWHDVLASNNKPADGNGHGTHITSVLASRRTCDVPAPSSDIRFDGVAPEADLVAVRAFDNLGRSTYADVISAIDWVVAHRAVHDIRVLNLSFSAPAVSSYWEDPINQAVTAAWRAGIVVVTSAGNSGPDPMTIGVPGNNPYVITVGGMSDNYTPLDTGDDFLSSYSASGPTIDAFVKPEVVAPGGHIQGIMPQSSYLAGEHPEFQIDWLIFEMSGTSQAAAVVSGVVALMLEADPSLSPDDVKCRLMDSAKAAVTAGGEPAYSVYQQGAGLVDAAAAVLSNATGCANVGLDVDLDVAGLEHYTGPATWDDENSSFYVDSAHAWDGAYLSGG